MVQPLSGPGVGLPVPQSLYPANLTNGELVPSSGFIGLPPGTQLPIPRGMWWVSLGGAAVLQYNDPVMGIWRTFASARVSPLKVDSDGFNFRVANVTGCAIGALITNAGSAYTSAPAVAASASGSTWQAIVGGAVNPTISISAAGSGYGVPPLVFVPPPPAPGVPARMVAVISSGTVSSITVLDQGAGYQTAPPIALYPNPTDPNLLAGSAITNATAVAALTGSANKVSAVLCTNPGAAFSAVPSLTFSGGGGTSAAATIVPMWTVTGTSITSGGAGYTTNAVLTTVGGVPSATAVWTNPSIELTGYISRPAQIGIAAAGGGTISTIGSIIDGGLFAGTPTALVAGAAASTPATITLTLGSANASVELHPAG